MFFISAFRDPSFSIHEPTDTSGNLLNFDGILFRDDDVENTFPSCAITSLNENCVFLYEHYKEVHKEFVKQLEKHDIDIIFVPFRHQHWFSQGITCLTLELYRLGDKQTYV